MSFFDKLGKALKTSIKLNVTIAIQSVTLSCSELVYFKPQVQRGDQCAEDLRVFGIKPQEMKASKVGGEQCRTTLESKFYIDAG